MRLLDVGGPVEYKYMGGWRAVGGRRKEGAMQDAAECVGVRVCASVCECVRYVDESV